MTQLKTLLIATDFSASSIEAALTARRLAELFGSTLHVVYVIEQLAGYTDLEIPTDPVPPLLRVQARESQTVLEQFANEHLGGLPETQRHLRIGRVYEEIQRAASACHADLVVGTQGNSGLAELVLGSVAARVISHAQVPVLSLRTAPRLETGIKLLVATDLSDASRQATLLAGPLAERLAATVTLLTVLEPPNRLAFWRMEPAESKEQAEARLRPQLEAFARTNLPPGVPWDVEIRVGTPQEEIAHTVRRLPADLLLMGANSQPRLGGLWMGSVAERVLHTTPVAMITTRSPGSTP